MVIGNDNGNGNDNENDNDNKNTIDNDNENKYDDDSDAENDNDNFIDNVGGDDDDDDNNNDCDNGNGNDNDNDNDIDNDNDNKYDDDRDAENDNDNIIDSDDSDDDNVNGINFYLCRAAPSGFLRKVLSGLSVSILDDDSDKNSDNDNNKNDNNNNNDNTPWPFHKIPNVFQSVYIIDRWNKNFKLTVVQMISQVLNRTSSLATERARVWPTFHEQTGLDLAHSVRQRDWFVKRITLFCRRDISGTGTGGQMEHWIGKNTRSLLRIWRKKTKKQ